MTSIQFSHESQYFSANKSKPNYDSIFFFHFIQYVWRLKQNQIKSDFGLCWSLVTWKLSLIIDQQWLFITIFFPKLTQMIRCSFWCKEDPCLKQHHRCTTSLNSLIWLGYHLLMKSLQDLWQVIYSFLFLTYASLQFTFTMVITYSNTSPGSPSSSFSFNLGKAGLRASGN